MRLHFTLADVNRSCVCYISYDYFLKISVSQNITYINNICGKI